MPLFINVFHADDGHDLLKRIYSIDEIRVRDFPCYKRFYVFVLYFIVYDGCFTKMKCNDVALW